MSVSTWLYVSRSQLSTAEAEAELEFIVSTSQRRNHDLGVTGALLFTGTCFAQCVEGPLASVRLLRRDISRDSRHENVVTLAAGTARERRFSDWSLAYTGPSPLVARVVDEAIRDAAADTPRAASDVLRLLSNFSPLS